MIGAEPRVLSWIEQGVRIPFRSGPPPPFHHGVSMTDATPAQLEFLSTELPRFYESGAFEDGSCARWVSRMFLVPKPGENRWRVIIDLRHLNNYCKNFGLKLETLKRLRYLGRKNDWMFSFDLADGYYALGIAQEHRDYFSFALRNAGVLHTDTTQDSERIVRLAGLPMGWCLSPWFFVQLMQVVVRHLRAPLCTRAQARRQPSRRYLRNQRWKGARMLPFMDDYLFLCSTREEALELRERVDELLMQLGLARNPAKGQWEPVQVITHLGLEIDSRSFELRAPAEKLEGISRMAHGILSQAARSKRWVPARSLAALAGKCQFLYLAIAPARFYLRELHNVLSTKSSWSGRVRLTKQLTRDLGWWRSVPTQANGRPIFRAVETAYLHVDSSAYGWGAVLNNQAEARGFWYDTDRQQHITFKELKAVRYAVETFLPQLRHRSVLLHEDNQAVVAVLTHLTSRSPAMMNELRKLWWLLDTNNITVRARYIRSAANIWADRLSRELDRADWTLNPRVFRYLDRLWGPHSVDRFASMENALICRYNSRWNDPGAEAVDCLRLPDVAWRAEVNWCNPPWELLDDLILKLRRSGAAATVVAPRWLERDWYQQLCDMASESITYPPAHDLFYPGRSGERDGVGKSRWSVTVFRVPRRAGCA